MLKLKLKLLSFSFVLFATNEIWKEHPDCKNILLDSDHTRGKLPIKLQEVAAAALKNTK